MSFAITATIAAVATVGSLVSAEKGRSQQKKANKVQERVRQTQDARSRIAQVREARLAQAQVLQAGATQGSLGSSAVQGGYSAIGSNAENNIQFINQIDSLQQSYSRRMESASNWQGAAQGFGAVASVAGAFAGGAGGGTAGNAGTAGAGVGKGGSSLGSPVGNRMGGG